MFLSHTSGHKDVAVAMGTEEEVIPSAALLADFAEAASTGLLMPAAAGEVRMSSLRRAMAHALGEGALLDAAAVAATFDGINKIADACAVKMDDMGGAGRHVENAIKLLDKMGVEAPTYWGSTTAAPVV